MEDRTEQLHRALQKFIYHVDELSNENDPSGNGFHREYRDLRELGLQNKDTYPATHGKIPYNIKKNRYKDIVPFDETRVTLKEKPGVQGSDYINANFILDAHQRNGYIASQGPLPHTLEDFWRMIHEHEVKVVMMACKEVEVGKKKCAQYWVEEGAENGIFDEYQVGCVREDNLAEDCHERHLQLILPDSNKQEVFQYHYTGWPDHGIPDDIDVILAMIKRMRDIRMNDQDHAPVVVHCSAGCGRTGTICAIDYAWELLKSGQMSEDFNLFEIVKSMREQRQSMIQTPEQYEMAHLAIKELFQKHIEIMNETEYVNVELKRDDDYYNVTLGENEDRESDFKKLQKDALDTLERYMGPVEETQKIPVMDPEIVSKKPEIVSKKPEIVQIVPKEPEIVSKEPEIKQTSEEDQTVIKMVENSNIQQKVEQEQIQRRPYVNVDPSDGAPVGETDSKPQSSSVGHLRNSFQKKQSSSSPTESGPKLSGQHSLSESISKKADVPPPSPKKLNSNNPNQGLPPTVPKTTMVTQTPISGPRFAGPKTVQTPQQEIVHPPPVQSGPRFVQSHVQSTSSPKSQENVPKFKSVINIGTSSIITQGNKPQNGIGGRQGSVNRTKTQPSNDDYEMAFPVAENNRVSTNNITINSNTSTAVYAVPDKTTGAPINPSNVYSEVQKVHSSKPDKVGPVDSTYEAIDMIPPVKPAPQKGRAYEEVELPSDGLYTTVGDTADQNDAPPVPKREYQEPEQNTDHKTSMTDKLKNKFSNTLFSSNSKGSSSSDNTDNKAVPGYNERLDKKVKGPRAMPWNKKKTKL